MTFCDCRPHQVLEARLGLRKGSTPNTLGAAFITSAATVLFTAPVDFLRTQVIARPSTP